MMYNITVILRPNRLTNQFTSLYHKVDAVAHIVKDKFLFIERSTGATVSFRLKSIERFYTEAVK